MRPLMICMLLLVSAAIAQSSQNQASGNGTASQHDDEVFQAGAPGIRPPKAISTPTPEYSEDARRKKITGTVILSFIVGKDGLPSNIRVTRSLYPSLDQEAIDSVKNWKFQPATKDGQPVSMQISTEVEFRLYKH